MSAGTPFPQNERETLDKRAKLCYTQIMKIETYPLNNGMEIPKVGLGTYRIAPDDCEKTVSAAIQSGYRLIDTANVYMNERAVGRGVKNSGIARDEILIASKIWQARPSTQHSPVSALTHSTFSSCISPSAG